MSMTLQKVSKLSGETNTVWLPIEPFEYIDWLTADPQPYIQDAFPQLDADEREFILTGITSTEWDEAFGEEEEEEYELPSNVFQIGSVLKSKGG